jgi:hypothetical protein
MLLCLGIWCGRRCVRQPFGRGAGADAQRPAGRSERLLHCAVTDTVLALDLPARQAFPGITTYRAGQHRGHENARAGAMHPRCRRRRTHGDRGRQRRVLDRTGHTSCRGQHHRAPRARTPPEERVAARPALLRQRDRTLGAAQHSLLHIRQVCIGHRVDEYQAQPGLVDVERLCRDEGAAAVALAPVAVDRHGRHAAVRLPSPTVPVGRDVTVAPSGRVGPVTIHSNLTTFGRSVKLPVRSGERRRQREGDLQ